MLASTSLISRKSLLVIAFGLFSVASFSQSDLKLWYNKPAKQWTEALPVGNGTFGGMVFGKVDEELIQLNEATLWSGGPVKTNVNPGAFENLKPLREALFASDYGKATALAKKMQGYFSESFLPLGDLLIKQTYPDNNTSDYYRDLDLADAISTIKYTFRSDQNLTLSP